MNKSSNTEGKHNTVTHFYYNLLNVSYMILAVEFGADLEIKFENL